MPENSGKDSVPLEIVGEFACTKVGQQNPSLVQHLDPIAAFDFVATIDTV